MLAAGMRILLFSGGIDSTALAFHERPERLVFFDYGQVAAAGELRACRAIAEALFLPLDVHAVDLRPLGSGTMAGTGASTGVAEFWPFRNQMLVTLAAMFYEPRGLTELTIGTVASDRQHPDGSPQFIAALTNLLGIQSRNLSLRAPAAGEQTAALARRTGVPWDILGWTFSCHTGEWACGQCGGCAKHAEVMAELAQSP